MSTNRSNVSCLLESSFRSTGVRDKIRQSRSRSLKGRKMPLPTSVVGRFPKPDYLDIPDWFQTSYSGSFTKQYNRYLETSSESHKEINIRKASKEIIDIQTEAGLDVITDGEVRRESYILHFCRALNGLDFLKLSSKICRDEGVTTDVPRVIGEVTVKEREPWVWKEWKMSQGLSTLPVKMTLPGPMTIINSIEDQFYGDEKVFGSILAKIIKKEVKGLVSAGCQYIQDQVGYKKASKDGYFMLADRLDQAGFDQISIEDAHRHNDLSLFQHFKKSKIVLGSVKIACSRVESVEEIRNRLQEVLTVVPPDRLIVAPDCGLGFLPREIAKKKLCNMVQAAKSLP
ncbi:5-methyltetrahydropteroyltriglutamate--homocysteine methyltransferase-like isoform X3 [Montipora foliosa]|uniref:5-methyltetrahydropteroyltriglutamate-- homocysteine methyltransferase-like isoform X3 n=1 Tax=Montipora foliosa TaxID=591990 RepID=UPI0035F15914